MDEMGSNSTTNIHSVPDSPSYPTYENFMPVTTSYMSSKSKLQKFLAGDPKALGTTQILIGIVTITMGIAVAVQERIFSTDIGLPFWTSVMFITSGALTVAAANYQKICLVNTSLAFNIVSSVFAGISIIIHSFIFVIHGHYIRHSSERGSYIFLLVFLLIFAVLEMSISIAVSIFACRATCSCTDRNAEMPVVVVQYSTNPETKTITPVPSSSQNISLS